MTEPRASPPTGIPKGSEEYQVAADIWHQVLMLEWFTDQFRVALQLFDFVSTKKAETEAAIKQSETPGSAFPHAAMDADRLYSGWRFVAARDAVMSIYHFSETLRSVQKNIHFAPTYQAQSDPAVLREAAKSLAASFPKLEFFRDAIAHAATRTDTPNRKKETTAEGPISLRGLDVDSGSGAILSQHLNGSTFSMTVKQQVISYAINERTLEVLQKIKARVYSAFPGTSQAP